MPLLGCDEKHPEQRSVFLEEISLRGTCSEDHVKVTDQYSGSVVRWQEKATGEIDTYGFVQADNGVSPERLIAEAERPTEYRTPFIVEFWDISIDTGLSHWTLHGVSDRGENEQGYDSTCQLDVVGRSNVPPTDDATPSTE
jgi:hypothetical protein